MSVDLMLPAGEKIVLVLEAIGDDKIRVNSTSLDHPLTILADQVIEIVGIEKKVMVGRAMRLDRQSPQPQSRRHLRSHRGRRRRAALPALVQPRLQPHRTVLR